MERIIYQLIQRVQRGDQSAQFELYQQFQPLILKYSKLLNYEDAASDITLFFLELLPKIPLESFNRDFIDYQILSFIKTQVYREYIRLSKNNSAMSKIIQLDEFMIEASSSAIQQEAEFDLLMDQISNVLQKREYQIVCLKYQGYLESEIGRRLNIQRQAVYIAIKQIKYKIHQKGIL